MWLKSVYLKTLRDARVAILGWGGGIGLLMYYLLAAFHLAVNTQAAKEALVSLAAGFTWIAEPIQITTPGGYATWKYGFTILVLALWPILMGSRLLRGEEERGSLDMLLSLPRGRGRVALEKVAALLTALLVMGIIIALLTFAGSQSAGAGIGFGAALLFGLNLALVSAIFGGVALLVAQFTQSQRAASGIAGGVLLVAIVVDMAHRVIPNTEWLSRLSPVYYYNLSKPLIPSYGTNIGALVVLVALAVVLNGAALWLFVRRDIGAPVALPQWLRLPQRAANPARALPVADWSLRSVYARGLGRITAPTLWWTLGIAGFAGWMVAIVRQTEDKLAALYQGSPLLQNLIGKVGGGDVSTNATLLSFFFILLPLLLMGFAITQTSRWAADEEEGRQDPVLATPQSRQRVVLARFGAVATATVFIAVVTLAVTALSAAANGLVLDAPNLIGAALGIIPLGLLMAAIGYLLAGYLRGAVDTGFLSVLLVLWFFITFVGPGLNFPEAALRLSALYYYGTPLLHGLPLLDTLGILVVGAVALTLATLRFARKDIGR